MKQRYPNQSPRGGFTLVELLIVMAIILVLAGLALRFADTTGAREAATKATVTKIGALLQSRRTAFDRHVQKALKKEDLKNSETIEQRKIGFRNAFPQTKAEAMTAGYSPPSSSNNTAESAEVLYWLLTESNVYALPPANVDQFSASEIADTDDDGKMEFVDGWGRPLTFYRWPTGLVRPTDGGGIRKDVVELLISGLRSEMLKQDPDDPLGRFDSSAYHARKTYHTLLVVSAGADGKLGLTGARARPGSWFEEGIAPGDGPLNDNITNRQPR